jgi:membrane-associated phospholipid phosphatase
VSEPSQSTARPHRLLLRVVVTACALALWFWTQSLIAARPLPPSGIGDELHQLTAPLNAYFLQHTHAANVLLIVSSGIIDALALFLLASWLFGVSVRPFLGLCILLALRQLMQALCALPAPPNMIWHNPGFPSLLVTYSVANDYFFSGHTAIAVFAALELARRQRTWLSAAAFVIVLFEISAVIVLRAHYTMDVFTGIVAALWVSSLCERLAPAIDRRLVLRNAGKPAVS